MGQISSCPIEEFQVRIQETDRVCCSSGCNGNPVPVICDAECAVVWNDLYTDCGTTLSSIVGADQMPQFAAFQAQCLSLNKHSLLDAIAAAACRTFKSPFPFTTDAISTGADGVQIYGRADTVINSYHYVTQSSAVGTALSLPFTVSRRFFLLFWAEKQVPKLKPQFYTELHPKSLFTFFRKMTLASYTFSFLENVPPFQRSPLWCHRSGGAVCSRWTTWLGFPRGTS